MTHPVTTEDEAIAALEAVLSWAQGEPDSTASGGATGYTFQRGRIVATRIKPENTIGISTYETEQDAAEKARDMERAYQRWVRLTR